jgi:hypothetical protein
VKISQKRGKTSRWRSRISPGELSQVKTDQRAKYEVVKRLSSMTFSGVLALANEPADDLIHRLATSECERRLRKMTRAELAEIQVELLPESLRAIHQMSVRRALARVTQKAKSIAAKAKPKKKKSPPKTSPKRSRPPVGIRFSNVTAPPVGGDSVQPDWWREE